MLLDILRIIYKTMDEFKVCIKELDDHILHADKIVHVSSGKEFTDISDAMKNVNGGVAMLVNYYYIRFTIEDKGTIQMDDLGCNNRSIPAIYSYLRYLSGIGCDIDTYIKLTKFVENVCYDNNKSMIDVLLSLAYLQEERNL